MGSSRKDKDKDKEEKKHKHKHKDRDREKDKDRKRRHKHHKRDRSQRDDVEEETHHDEPVLKKERNIVEHQPDYYPDFDGNVEKEVDSTPSGGGGYTESLSIQETNKIRLKLGLAPLEDSNAPKQDSDGLPGMPPAGSTDVHKPAKNLAQEKKRKAIQEKLKLIKAKREINKKLSKVKTLGEDEDVDDIHAWVERSRKISKEKALADKRAKLLEEMDADFGIEALVDEEFKHVSKGKGYGSKDITGLQVQHSLKSFREGKSVILTLKDSGILDEEDDALVNVNMVDDVLAAKNTELRKGKPGYIPYEQEEVDEFGVVRKKALLQKYDEEIEGSRIESFKLGEANRSAFSRLSQEEQIRQTLQKQSLNMQGPTLASDYYSSIEMEKFKKPKKRRRKVKKFSVNDLTPDESRSDHGSRHGGIRKRNLEDATFENGDAMELDLPDIDGGVIRWPGQPSARVDENVVIEDEAALELQLALNKARRMKHKKDKKQMDGDKLIAEAVKQERDETMDEDETVNPSIVLNATSEFCRTLGDIPSYHSTLPKEEENEEEAIDFEKEEAEQMGDEEGVSAWSRVNLDEEDDEEDEEIEQPSGPVLEEEPSLQSGIAGALKMAVSKGFLEKESSKKYNAAKDKSIEAQNFHVENKSFHDIDAKYNKHDRFRGPSADFKEKSGYKPSFHLTYKDDSGREVNQKEAFRLLSHRFHGKCSGKLKTERRLKKIAGEEALLKMSSVDTPLGTVAMLQEKQRAMQSPYIMLSGGGSNVLNAANVMTKGNN